MDTSDIASMEGWGVMDLNMVVVCGRLAVDPEISTFDSGTQVAKLLVTVRVESPRRRVDVLPVTVWDRSEGFKTLVGDDAPTAGTRVWVTGSIQRRSWEGPSGRTSNIEIVAEHVALSVSTEMETR